MSVRSGGINDLMAKLCQYVLTSLCWLTAEDHGGRGLDMSQNLLACSAITLWSLHPDIQLDAVVRGRGCVWGNGPAACVLFFMLTALVTQQLLIAIERAGLIPLAESETTVLASLPNTYSLRTLIGFDRHVALLLRYNRTRPPISARAVSAMGTGLSTEPNDLQVYLSLLQIAHA